MRNFTFVIAVLFCYCLHSQGFRSRYCLPNAINNAARSIFETSPGNYITGGIVVDSLNGIYSNRLCIMGLDAAGQVIWSKKYGRKSFEYLDNYTTTRAFYKHGNNVYFTTCVRDSNNNQVGVLIKFNFNGDTLWQKIYRDPQEDVIPHIVTKSIDGGFLITGFFQNWSNNSNPCLLIKTDANGNELWRKKINKPFPNVSDGKAIVQDSASKKIVIAGMQYIGNASTWSTYDQVLILDSVGLVLSRHNYSGTNGFFSDLIQTKDKKYVAVGTTYQTMGGNDLNRSCIVKFDLDSPAFPVWSDIAFDNLNFKNSFDCVREASNGDLLIGGTIDTLQILNNPPHWLIRLVRMSSNGNLKWKQSYDYAPSNALINTQYMVSFDLASDNACIGSIYSYNSPSPNPFIYVRWDSTGCDTTLAYCQMVATELTNNMMPVNKFEIYPNPSDGIFYIEVPLLVGDVEMILRLYDISGRELQQLTVNGSSEKCKLDLTGFSAGTYLVSLYKKNVPLYIVKIFKQ